MKECCTEYCELHKEYMSLGERLLIQDFSQTLLERITVIDYEKDIKRELDSYIHRFKLTQTEMALIYDYYDFILKNIFGIEFVVDTEIDELENKIEALYNYFHDWHKDEMSSEAFSEMWDMILEDYEKYL